MDERLLSLSRVLAGRNTRGDGRASSRAALGGFELVSGPSLETPGAGCAQNSSASESPTEHFLRKMAAQTPATATREVHGIYSARAARPGQKKQIEAPSFLRCINAPGHRKTS